MVNFLSYVNDFMRRIVCETIRLIAVKFYIPDAESFLEDRNFVCFSSRVANRFVEATESNLSLIDIAKWEIM